MIGYVLLMADSTTMVDDISVIAVFVREKDVFHYMDTHNPPPGFIYYHEEAPLIFKMEVSDGAQENV